MFDFEKCCDGYRVPEGIKNRAINIMKRFNIIGVCDGMYISNVIASESGSGDGQNHFKGCDTVANHDSIADFLTRVYGCNIMKDDRADLMDILRDGEISNERMTEGLKKCIKQYCDEKKRFSRDKWRVEYLDKCITSAKELINEYERR